MIDRPGVCRGGHQNQLEFDRKISLAFNVDIKMFISSILNVSQVLKISNLNLGYFPQVFYLEFFISSALQKSILDFYFLQKGQAFAS